MWSSLVVGWSAAVACLVFFDVGIAVRPFVVIGFLLIVPGVAIVRALGLRDRIAEVTLGIALSTTIDGTVPGVLMYAGVWSSELALLIIIALTLAATLYELSGRRLPATG